jgi:hypothetical protein
MSQQFYESDCHPFLKKIVLLYRLLTLAIVAVFFFDYYYARGYIIHNKSVRLKRKIKVPLRKSLSYAMVS